MALIFLLGPFPRHPNQYPCDSALTRVVPGMPRPVLHNDISGLEINNLTIVQFKAHGAFEQNAVVN